MEDRQHNTLQSLRVPSQWCCYLSEVAIVVQFFSVGII